MHVDDDCEQVFEMNKAYLSHSSHIGSHRMYLRMCNEKDMDFASSSNTLNQPRVNLINQS